MGSHFRETGIGEGPGAFQSTLWTVVLRAKDPSAPGRRDALEKLIETYWRPLYNLVRRKGNDVETSKDITQGFFTELLSKDTLQYLEPGRARFRTYLRRVIENYMADRYAEAKAQKRGGGKPLLSLDFPSAEEDLSLQGAENPDQAYRRDWALRVMSQAMEAVEASFKSSGREAEFAAYRLHLTSTHPEGASYEELGRTLGISVEDVRNRIRAARARYRDAILDVIRSTTETEDEAREELRELLTAFS